ncbi:MAG: GNAT family N-acetyltransferase [Trueperaceae bacterium]|nr:GNAT family N-acetyltransferase [Trueperaceae bacterium]
MITIRRVRGDTLERYIPAIAQLRIEVFREFPYLYDGDLDYERRYLQTYADSGEAVAVLVWDDDEVVGASTALPLRDETDALRAPFAEHDYDVDDFFYFAESVLRKAYRGQGLGKRFFGEREEEARALDYPRACFCAIDRPADHPKRPDDDRPLDDFWRKRGFVKHPELRTTLSWQEIGEDGESAKPLVFWIKEL